MYQYPTADDPGSPRKNVLTTPEAIDGKMYRVPVRGRSKRPITASSARPSCRDRRTRVEFFPRFMVSLASVHRFAGMSPRQAVGEERRSALILDASWMAEKGVTRVFRLEGGPTATYVASTHVCYPRS
jgi:hypothetical protein